MKNSCRLLISFEPTFGNVDMVRAAVRGICIDFFHIADCGASITDFCLLVTELMNNAVEHAAADSLDAEIILTKNEAVFRLISAGHGFDPTVAATMPGSEENADGGYGLALIQELADGLEYERCKNRNMVTLRKTFPVPAGKER